MTLKMTTAQVVETSVTVTNSSFQNYTHPDDHTTRTTDTPGFKPFTNIQMNEHRITGLTNPPSSDDEAVNKKYVNENISKSIKPSHTPKHVFQYLMDDVNGWSTEYNVKVGSINDLPESRHSWDKKVLNITPIKNGRNYRFRVGLQM